MIEKIRSPMPTVEEILAGETQGGVPRPTFSVAPADIRLLTTRSFSASDIVGAQPSKLRRWTAIKALLRIIFLGD